jgi:hypothetical protein
MVPKIDFGHILEYAGDRFVIWPQKGQFKRAGVGKLNAKLFRRTARFPQSFFQHCIEILNEIWRETWPPECSFLGDIRIFSSGYKINSENTITNKKFTKNNFDSQGPLCIINLEFWNFLIKKLFKKQIDFLSGIRIFFRIPEQISQEGTFRISKLFFYITTKGLRPWCRDN